MNRRSLRCRLAEAWRKHSAEFDEIRPAVVICMYCGQTWPADHPATPNAILRHACHTEAAS